MPQPTQSSVHVDTPLTNYSLAYIQDANRFISQQVFPRINVMKQSDKYFTYTKADWFRDEAGRRADGTESVGSGYNLSSATYSCDVWAFHKDVGEQVRANSDVPLRPELDATQFVTQVLLQRQEAQWMTDFFGTSIWANDVTPTNLWSNQTASDPVGDIQTGITTILQNTGQMANTLVLGYQVFVQLKQHPDLIDRMKYSSMPTDRTLTPSLMAEVFGVDRVLVSSAIKNTAVEGATGSYSFHAGKHALLCHSPASAGLLTPMAAATFVWTPISDGMGASIGISRLDMPHLRATRIEGQVAFDNKVIATDLGYFFNGAVA